MITDTDPRRERWKREDAAEAKEIAARALALSEKETRAATEKLRRETQALERRYAQWDSLRESKEFEEYLVERGLVISSKSGAPPNDLEAEQAALGAMLMGNNDVIRIGLSELPASSFYLKRHSVIRDAIEAVFVRPDRPCVDCITVNSELRTRGTIESCGGATYLMALIDSCPSDINIRAYIKPVVETAQQRALREMCQVVKAVVVESGEWSRDGLARVTAKPAYPTWRIILAVRHACSQIEENMMPDWKKLLDRCE